MRSCAICYGGGLAEKRTAASGSDARQVLDEGKAGGGSGLPCERPPGP